jgi:hypothetical protein
MTKKDFKFIADQFKLLIDSAHHIEDETAYEMAAIHFSKTLSQTNPRFDRKRFVSACGINPEQYGI